MKLFEVMSPPKQLKKGYSAASVPYAFRSASAGRHPYSLKHKGNLEYIGSGAFAQVYGHKNRPASAFKVGIGDTDYTYLQYIAKASQNERWKSNPYLPRVHSQKNYKDQGGGAAYVVELEKLEPFMDIEQEEVEAIIDKAFHSLPKDKYLNDLPRQYDVVKALQRAAAGRSDAIKNIKDKQLLQAIAIIGNIGKSQITIGKKTGPDARLNAAQYLDIHTSNVMIRRTPVGAQLVITDPLI